jgi:hypothetical protein
MSQLLVPGPAMEGQSIIRRYAALIGGDAGDAISVSVAVCAPGKVRRTKRIPDMRPHRIHFAVTLDLKRLRCVLLST